MNDQSSDQSFLSGANATFINELYKEWKENSNSVPKEWDLWFKANADDNLFCLLYTSPSPRDEKVSRMPSSA